MPPAKRAAAAPKKAAAATAETKPEPKHIDFRGVQFTLPEKMPGSLLWDFSDLESTDDATAATMRMLESLLGRDQYLAARRKVVEDGIPFDEIEDVIGELMTSIFDVYGLDLGETVSLGRLLADRWDAIEADFQRYYQLDLRTEFDTAGCRRLWILVDGLPTDAATWRKEFAWTQEDELAAYHIEVTSMWLRILAILLNAKQSSLPEGAAIPRPGDEREPEKKKSSIASIAEFFKTHM